MDIFKWPRWSVWRLALTCVLCTAWGNAESRKVCSDDVSFNDARACCEHKGPEWNLPRDHIPIVWEMKLRRLSRVWLDMRRKDQWEWVNGTTYIDTDLPRTGLAACAVFDRKTGKIVPRRCESPEIGLMCQVPGCSQCPVNSNYSCHSVDGVCIITSSHTDSWRDTRAICRLKGGELVAKDPCHFLDIFKEKPQSFARYVWLGLRVVTWTSTSGIEPTVTDWGDGEPSTEGNCAEIFKTGGRFRWRAVNCEEKRPVVCASYKEGNILSQVGMSTSVTSSEPPLRPFTSFHKPGNQPHVGMVAAVSVCATLLVVVFVGAILYLLRRRLTSMDLRHDVESGSYHRTEKTDTSVTDLSRLVAANILARYEKLQLWGWGDDTVAVPIDQIYTEMRWVEKVHTIAGTKVQTLNHYSDMFSEVLNQQTTRNIILGDPGVGKTTFAYRLLVDWSRAILGRNDSRITPEIHERLVSMKFVVPIFLREVKENQALEDIIADQLSLDSDEASALWMYIQNHKSQVLFVLEGYDEFDENKCKYLADIVRGQRLFGIHLVTTLRTCAFSSVITNIWAVTGRLQLIGFSCEGVKNYIHRYFNSIERGQNKAEELIGRISKQEELQRFSRFPAVLLLMCKLWQEDGSLKDTLTSFYTDILIYMCGRYEKKTLPLHKRAPTISILKKYRKEILAIGKLALQALSGKHLQLLFSYECVKALGDIAKNLGFFRIIQGANGCVRAEFHHKTLQEYFAAFYIVNCGSDDGLQHLLRVCSISKCLHDCKVIITFVCGMSRKMGNKVRHRIEKVSRTWDTQEEVSAKDRSDFLITFLSENSSVVFPLPAEIELEPGKYTQSVLDRFFSMDATAVTSIIFNTKYLAYISQIRKLNINALETLEVNAIAFSVGGPVKVNEDSLLEFAKYMKINQLKVKQVRGNDNFTVLTYILRCVKCVQIDILDLNLNKFGVKGLEGLAEILPLLRGLKQLWLRACQCDDHLAWSRFFPSLSHVPELEIINLSLNSIGRDAIDILSQQLPKLTKLHDLRLQSCGICCCCTALTVLEQLPKVPTLKKLDFCDNGLGDGLLKLTEKKFSLGQLEELNLGQNRLSDDVKTQLKMYISQEYPDLALKL